MQNRKISTIKSWHQWCRKAGYREHCPLHPFSETGGVTIKDPLGRAHSLENPIVCSPFQMYFPANFQAQSQVTSQNKLCYLQWNIFVVIHFPHGRSQKGALYRPGGTQNHCGFIASSYCTNTDLFSTWLGFPGGSEGKEIHL